MKSALVNCEKLGGKEMSGHKKTLKIGIIGCGGIAAGEMFGKLVVTKPEVNTSIAYYGSKAETEGDREGRQWLEAIIEDKEPLVKAEEAYVVTKILEALYESSENGKEVVFD